MYFFEDSQLMLVPYFALSYGSDFDKKYSRVPVHPIVVPV
jgi:hypothetical protein